MDPRALAGGASGDRAPRRGLSNRNAAPCRCAGRRSRARDPGGEDLVGGFRHALGAGAAPRPSRTQADRRPGVYALRKAACRAGLRRRPGRRPSRGTGLSPVTGAGIVPGRFRSHGRDAHATSTADFTYNHVLSHQLHAVVAHATSTADFTSNHTRCCGPTD